jgi:hypothetical protein
MVEQSETINRAVGITMGFAAAQPCWTKNLLEQKLRSPVYGSIGFSSLLARHGSREAL